MAGNPGNTRGRRRSGAQRAKSRGFTLVELAIVLVLIGLLVGTMLLGNGLLVQSRIKFVANEFEQLKVAVITYQDRYAALPGDDARAASRWVGRSKDGTGDGRISGSYQAVPPGGDPVVALTVDATAGESLNFWWQLRLAGLIVAPPPVVTPVAQPMNAYSGVVGVEWAALGFPRLTVCAANLPGEVAIGVESQLDDGNPRRGLVRAAKQTVDNEAIASADATITTFTTGDADMYILCRRLD
jgi:prepilin-type N-terminal cleavage/methylation domain-containing protein